MAKLFEMYYREQAGSGGYYHLVSAGEKQTQGNGSKLTKLGS